MRQTRHKKHLNQSGFWKRNLLSKNSRPFLRKRRH